MNEIKIFSNPEFGDIRTAGTSDEPLFCLADLCRVVELTNPSSVKRRLDADDMQVIDLHALNCTTEEKVGNTLATFINETAFYEVLLFSSSPKVKPFRRWVTHEVLPSIRKTGGYMMLMDNEEDEAIWARAVALANATLARRTEQLKQKQAELDSAKPKLDYYDKVMMSTSALTANQVAKMLGMSARKLNQLLLEKHICYKQSGQYLLYSPYDRMGLTQNRTAHYELPNGETVAKNYTVWTQKGAHFIIEQLKSNNYGKLHK